MKPYEVHWNLSAFPDLRRLANCGYCTKELPVKLAIYAQPFNLIPVHKIIVENPDSSIPKLTEQKVTSLECCNTNQAQLIQVSILPTPLCPFMDRTYNSASYFYYLTFALTSSSISSIRQVQLRALCPTRRKQPYIQRDQFILRNSCIFNYFHVSSIKNKFVKKIK